MKQDEAEQCLKKLMITHNHLYYYKGFSISINIFEFSRRNYDVISEKIAFPILYPENVLT